MRARNNGPKLQSSLRVFLELYFMEHLRPVNVKRPFYKVTRKIRPLARSFCIPTTQFICSCNITLTLCNLILLYYAYCKCRTLQQNPIQRRNLHELN